MIVSISGFILTFNVLELCHAYIYLKTFQSTIYLDLGKYQNMIFRLSSLKICCFCKSIKISIILFLTCNHELNFLKSPFCSLKYNFVAWRPFKSKCHVKSVNIYVLCEGNSNFILESCDSMRDKLKS